VSFKLRSSAFSHKNICQHSEAEISVGVIIMSWM